MRYGALLHAKGGKEADVEIKCSSKALLLLASGDGEKFSQIAEIKGETEKFEKILTALHRFQGGAVGSFNIIEP